VTCAGIVIGSAEFPSLAGVAHARLDPDPGYPFAARAALKLGAELSGGLYWPADRGDFSDEASRRWNGDRLALLDELGRELGVNNVTVVEYPTRRGTGPIVVVADFRPDLARVEAFLRTIGPTDRRRPAA
jgi:hypothetical protein